MRRLMLAAVTGLVCAVVSPTSGADRIEVPCEQHKQLTGQDLCHVLPTIKWKRTEWEAMQASRTRSACRDAVWRKYAERGRYGIRHDSAGWHQDRKPKDVAEKDWISCSPPKLWSGEESFECYEELALCEPKRRTPPPKKAIKIFQ